MALLSKCVLAKSPQVVASSAAAAFLEVLASRTVELFDLPPRSNAGIYMRNRPEKGLGLLRRNDPLIRPSA